MIAAAAHAETLSYWIAPGPDGDLAEWALAAWQKASDGKLEFKRTNIRKEARIRIIWASAEEGMYGETRGGDVYVRPAPVESDDALLRDAITYLTCLHESGHALGLPHTAHFEDIMYTFQLGGDIHEYFGRYRRKLRSREDIRKNPGLSAGDVEQIKLATNGHK